MNYQVDYAVEQTLDYMSRALCDPLKDWEVTLEPRISTTDGLTNWDVGFNPEKKLFELKLKPTRKDVLDWVGRSARDATAKPERTYYLVYSKGAGNYFDELEQLIRIAVEVNGNVSEFASRLKAEDVTEESAYLRLLGNDAHQLLRRMSMDHVPEYFLKTNIEFRARQLADDKGGRLLREFLFTKFHKAIPRRQVFSVLELISEAQSHGVEFRPAPSFKPNDLPSTASAALVIMQACRVGIPADVIASALALSEESIQEQLLDLTNRHVVTLDEEHLWSLKPLPTPIRLEGEQEVLAKALSSLLAFIENLPANAGIRHHVSNVISLSKRCRVSHPSLVAKVFSRLDKKLKRIGNKRLVWFVANLSIKACRSIRDRDRSEAEAQAQALICGTSWAFQRLHKIDKARIDADEAYDLALSIRSDKSIAYSLKCRGRLCRMESEQMPNGVEKAEKLKESIALLSESIDRFSQLVEFGPEDPEVGDCYSLLGRTYLALGELANAEAALQRANRLIVDETSKDYIDLMILKGDVEVAKGSRQSASSFYDRAIAMSAAVPDPEITEMRARAIFRRGVNREALGQKVTAEADYESSRDIWLALQDEQLAAMASWEKIRISKSISAESVALLTNECPDLKVRVEAVALHHRELELSGQRAVARRSEPPKGYWRQVIKRAKERVALRGERSETEW